MYETSKPFTSKMFDADKAHYSHMLSACLGEVSACLVRVPTEVVKSKMQIGAEGSETVMSTVKLIGFSNLYRGEGWHGQRGATGEERAAKSNRRGTRISDGLFRSHCSERAAQKALLESGC